MESAVVEAPHLPMSTDTEQTSQQSVADTNTSVAGSSSSSEMSSQPELPPMHSLLYHASEQDLNMLRQEQAERAAGMQLRWMQGNAVAAPFFPAFVAPPVHPPAS
eukprot:11453-Heterococcus_DN1.PRE.2